MLKYDEVAQKIEQNIYTAALAAGTRLANIEELIKQYQVSRTTIIKALDILERRGIIYQQQGSGIFVRQKKKPGYISFIESHGFTNDQKQQPSFTKVIELTQVKPSQTIAKALQCDLNEDLYLVKRLRYINNQIHCLECSYYRKKIVPYLNIEITSGSIFNYIKQVFNINIGFSDKYFEVTTLEADNAALLELPQGSPTLYVEEIFYTSAGEPFDYSIKHYHYKNSKYFVQSQLS
ncbi:GntR family transcriptional regulator of bglA [Orbus hercynius]|uniref:GntR family transcriptional regulator of bglA n=1 Tax=Orbus hercynius TaxID=593135 RepID=A0A495RIZ7_9GAMM|nr:GntR family transcriptional regulator [Orbus hercynius]RKS87381.1 GntR family transcriptional regulator of bglA [Orbus hercynius]